MLLPIGDDDRSLTGPSTITTGLLVANVAVFVYQMMNPAFTYGWSVIPAEITSGVDLVGNTSIAPGLEIPQMPGPRPIFLTLLSSMFMHGGFAHLAGNLLYLWIFGDNVEHRFGHLRFLLFYIVSGLAASFAQIATAPGSLIPNLGASGAISGVMGAYLVLFPRNRVYAIFFFVIVSIPAFVSIGLWIALQFVNGLGAIAMTEQTGGVAYAAHIGGFAAGVVMALFVRMTTRAERDSMMFRRYERDVRSRQLW